MLDTIEISRRRLQFWCGNGNVNSNGVVDPLQLVQVSKMLRSGSAAQYDQPSELRVAIVGNLVDRVMACGDGETEIRMNRDN